MLKMVKICFKFEDKVKCLPSIDAYLLSPPMRRAFRNAVRHFERYKNLICLQQQGLLLNDVRLTLDELWKDYMMMTLSVGTFKHRLFHHAVNKIINKPWNDMEEFGKESVMSLKGNVNDNNCSDERNCWF